MSTRSIRVALVNDHPLVMEGLRALLAPYSDRLRVVEMTAQANVVSSVDLALYDAFATGADAGVLAELLANPVISRVAVYSWDATPERVRTASDQGVAGWLSKALDAPGLVKAIESLHAGQWVALRAVADYDSSNGDWPGRAHGLTAREADVVTLITLGLNNNEIAEQTYLSINTVKSYIRSAYRTMGVTTRSQAVLWGLDHGLRPQPLRAICPIRRNGAMSPTPRDVVREAEA